MANLTLRSVKGAPLTHEELDGNFEYFTGSIDAINDATASFITSDDTGSFVTAAQTASLNISDAKYTVSTALSASVTSSATTSICSYGVNVFEHVTPTNFATKLPQPVTGKSVRIINNGSTLLSIFPSNIGGQINNYPIDTPAVIPPDGNLYEFICIENPLPGAWTFSAPATGQYDSGEIEVSITARSINSTTNPVVIACNSNSFKLNQNFFSQNWGYNGKNKPFILNNEAFRPETPWKGIYKIKIYTNLINSTQTRNTLFRLAGGGESDYYSPFDDTVLNTRLAESNNELFRSFLSNAISGTPVTGSTQYTSANVGDAGTLWMEKTAYSDQFYSNVRIGADGDTFIGNKTLGTMPYPYGQTFDNSDNEINTGDPVEAFYSSYISFQIKPFVYEFDYGTIPDFKFRFIIEYFQ